MASCRLFEGLSYEHNSGWSRLMQLSQGEPRSHFTCEGTDDQAQIRKPDGGVLTLRLWHA
jgi:hypothetical protein